MSERANLIQKMKDSVAGQKALVDSYERTGIWGKSEERRFNLHQAIFDTSAALMRALDRQAA